MLKGHMSLLYLGCRKFPTNRFVRNFCPYFNINQILIYGKYILTVYMQSLTKTNEKN